MLGLRLSDKGSDLEPTDRTKVRHPCGLTMASKYSCPHKPDYALLGPQEEFDILHIDEALWLW